MNFIFEQIRAGGDRNFSYLVGDRAAGVAAVVDPSYEPENALERAEAQGLKITLILCTHGHVDHVSGNEKLREITGAKVGAHRSSPVRPDVPLADGDTLAVGEVGIRVLHVPGHCPDHLLFFLPEQKIAITGDHLFVGKIGGTSTDAEALQEYESLERVMAELPAETTIWPGHDYGCRPSSTLALERLMNPFLLTQDFADFLKLKREWAEFKARKGLM
jgi:glyoxylase-like metal-dependent hydrolase (beta-lactamase superfamily II)